MEISTGLGIVIFGLLYCARSAYEVYGHTKLQKMRLEDGRVLLRERLASDER